MDTNRKILIGAISAAVVIGGAAIGLVLSRGTETSNLSTIHTQAPSETPSEPPAESMTQPASEATKETTPEDAGTSSSVTADIETYTSGNISIQYPVVSQMEDQERQNKVNEHLKANALSVIKAHQLDESADTLTIKCSVISVDSKRLTASYTGLLTAKDAAHPLNIFYTNTVNLLQVQDMGLNDFTDAYTMAGYVLSDDVTFSGISADVEEAVLEYRSTLDLDTLTAIFDGSDFPLSAENQWPESFSYEKQGTILFSLPVPHALGDYVMVSFDPSTK